MKNIVFLFCTFFSLLSFGNAEESILEPASGIRYTSEDFDIFPLTTSNSGLIQGVWTGNSVVIEVEDLELAFNSDLHMWVTISNKKTLEKRNALLYYNDEHGSYELYVFELGISVPLEIMIFKYSGRMAVVRKMKCAKGGYVMKLKFRLSEGESQAVQLRRETCSEQ